MKKKKDQAKKAPRPTGQPASIPEPESLAPPADQKVAFFPFHAINDFMTEEFRSEVVRTVFTRLNELPEAQRASVERISKKMVQVPGFRNSAKAPNALKVKPAAAAFEKSPHLVAAVLSAWAALNPTLSQQVSDLLTGRGWELLPPETDRTRLPGFLTRWPKSEDFETINTAFTAAHPEVSVESNDVSLMTVWLSGRLPYTLVDDEADEEEEGSEGEA